MLAARETGKTALPLPENKVPVFDVVLCFKNALHRTGHWDLMRAAILGTPGRQADNLVSEINLGPA
jgi:hypothetical protein